MKKAPPFVLRTTMQILLLLFINLTSFSQARTVTGKVTDSSNAPLANVSVQVKGTGTGTTTNLNGNFSLSVPSTASVLVFSYTGMERQEITVGDQSTISVQLKAAGGTLNEVVVIGYGTARKSDLYLELCYENKVWFDMLRTRKVLNDITKNFDDFIGHTTVWGKTFTEKQLLFPIPQREINNNTNLT